MMSLPHCSGWTILSACEKPSYRFFIPIFHADDTYILTGMGTAFALDPLGNFLSADHVADFLRRGVTEQSGEIAIPRGAHALALHGMGLVFGEVGIPKEALVQMTGTRADRERGLTTLPF
jgi:hypothetical protein